RGDFAALFDRPRYPTTTMGAMAAFRQIMFDVGWQQQLSVWRVSDPGTRRTPFDLDLDALSRLSDEWAGIHGHNTGVPEMVSLKPVIFIANTENEIHRALNM